MISNKDIRNNRKYRNQVRIVLWCIITAWNGTVLAISFSRQNTINNMLLNAIVFFCIFSILLIVLAFFSIIESNKYEEKFDKEKKELHELFSNKADYKTYKKNASDNYTSKEKNWILIKKISETAFLIFSFFSTILFIFSF